MIVVAICARNTADLVLANILVVATTFTPITSLGDVILIVPSTNMRGPIVFVSATILGVTRLCLLDLIFVC